MKKYNILEIIWHDLGDFLSLYGQDYVENPALDTLAKQGVLFDNCFCTAPQCCPSRAALKTGRHPQSNGMLGLTHRGFSYNPGEMTTPEILGGLGYETYLFGFQHEHPHGQPLPYKHVFEPSEDCDIVADAAIDFIKTGGGQSPFFASVGFEQVHRLFGIEYDPAKLDKIKIPPYLPNTPEVLKDIATFLPHIKKADAAVGRIMQALADTGLEQNTLVYFTTDHGPEFPRAKMTLYDPGTKIAMIMRLPGVLPADTRTDLLVSNIDVLPTLLQIIGAPCPEYIQGKAFYDALLGLEPGQEQVYSQITWHGGEYFPQRAIRTKHYKYIMNFNPGWPILMGEYVRRYTPEIIEQYYSSPCPAAELYDLKNDPSELENLAENPEYAQVRAGLEARLTAHLSAIDDPVLKGPVPHASPKNVGSSIRWGKFSSLFPHEQPGEMLKIIDLKGSFGEEPF